MLSSRDMWTRAALIMGTLGAFSACSAGQPASAQRGGTTAARVDRKVDRHDSRKPLRIFEGFASYYSDALAGRRTSNGERYDPAKRTAASRDLPFGTLVRVVRSDTGKHVIVRINDRGPFGDRRRILDLSRAAARELGIVNAGVAHVRAEVIELGPSRARRSSSKSSTRRSTRAR